MFLKKTYRHSLRGYPVIPRQIEYVKFYHKFLDIGQSQNTPPPPQSKPPILHQIGLVKCKMIYTVVLTSKLLKVLESICYPLVIPTQNFIIGQNLKISFLKNRILGLCPEFLHYFNFQSFIIMEVDFSITQTKSALFSS